MLKKIKDILEFIKNNIKILLEFLMNHAIEINVKHKATEETTKSIKITNLFLIFALCIIIAGFFLVARIKTIFFP